MQLRWVGRGAKMAEVTRLSEMGCLLLGKRREANFCTVLPCPPPLETALRSCSSVGSRVHLLCIKCGLMLGRNSIDAAGKCRCCSDEGRFGKYRQAQAGALGRYLDNGCVRSTSPFRMR